MREGGTRERASEGERERERGRAGERERAREGVAITDARTLSRWTVSEGRRHVTGREVGRGGGKITPSRRNSDTLRSETSVGWLLANTRCPLT